MATDDVHVLTSLVRQYQAAKQMDLLLFIDSFVYYDPSLPPPADQEWQTPEINGTLNGGDADGRPFSRFLATRVLPPPPRKYAGVWPYKKDDEHYPDYIIGTDDVGTAVLSTCNPDKLATSSVGILTLPFT